MFSLFPQRREANGRYPRAAEASGASQRERYCECGESDLSISIGSGARWPNKR